MRRSRSYVCVGGVDTRETLEGCGRRADSRLQRGRFGLPLPARKMSSDDDFLGSKGYARQLAAVALAPASPPGDASESGGDSGGDSGGLSGGLSGCNDDSGGDSEGQLVAPLAARSRPSRLQLALRETAPASRCDLQKLLLAGHMRACKAKKRATNTEARLRDRLQAQARHVRNSTVRDVAALRTRSDEDFVLAVSRRGDDGLKHFKLNRHSWLRISCE